MGKKSNAFLETEPVGKLMAKYAVPCVISLLVAALYNIVDQIFIANADYLGCRTLDTDTESRRSGKLPEPVKGIS